MKIAIVGSRAFADKQAFLTFACALGDDTEIVSGGARSGPDMWAREFAQAMGCPYTEFPADWSKYGRRAGALRNQQIVDYADEVVAFWDGTSPGTEITIDMARRAGKPCRVFGPDGEEPTP